MDAGTTNTFFDRLRSLDMFAFGYPPDVPTWNITDGCAPSFFNLSCTFTRRLQQHDRMENIMTYIDRLKAEKDELSDKLEKLSAFIGGDVFNGLSEINRSLLVDQKAHMTAYLSVLVARLEAA